jgi:hypothetical protein
MLANCQKRRRCLISHARCGSYVFTHRTQWSWSSWTVASKVWSKGRREAVTRWEKGERTVQYLISRDRLESVEAEDLAASAEALVGRATLRVEATAAAALKAGDVDGAYVAAYDAYRMAAESLLVRQGLRATGGDGSHMAVEDAVSAQFGADIPAFAKTTFERLRRTRHSAQYFDPAAAPITKQDASWAIEKAKAATSGVKALLAMSPPERFS